MEAQLSMAPLLLLRRASSHLTGARMRACAQVTEKAGGNVAAQNGIMGNVAALGRIMSNKLRLSGRRCAAAAAGDRRCTPALGALRNAAPGLHAAAASWLQSGAIRTALVRPLPPPLPDAGAP